MNKHIQFFSFNPPINFSEESKWSLPLASFKATNSVVIITNRNTSFSIIIPGHWDSKSAEKTDNELKKLSELRSQKSIDVMYKKLKKRKSIKKRRQWR